jgi:hypothetical protein
MTNGKRFRADLLVKDQRQHTLPSGIVLEQRVADCDGLMGERGGKLLVAQVIRRRRLGLVSSTIGAGTSMPIAWIAPTPAGEAMLPVNAAIRVKDVLS